MKNKSNGFTLLELMLSVVLSSIVMVGAATLHINVFKQEQQQYEIIRQFQEAKTVFDQFQTLVTSGGLDQPAPVVSSNRKWITSDYGTLGTSGKDVVFIRPDKEEVILAENSAVAFGYTPATETYNISLIRSDRDDELVATAKRKWQ